MVRKLPSSGDAPRTTGVPGSLVPGGAVDSGGYPWAGRTFEHHGAEFADDDGCTPQEWADAVRRLRAAVQEARAAVEARTAVEQGPALQHLAEVHADALEILSCQRLLVPLVTEAGDLGVTPEGRTVEKTQELSMVTVAAPDGRRAMPVFSSVEAMHRWNDGARPIPQPAPQVAVAAAGEHTDIVMIDAGSPELEFGVRRTALESVALGVRLLPSWADPEVIEAFRVSFADESRVHEVQLTPGDPEARLVAPETDVLLKLEPGLGRDDLQSILARAQQRWAASEPIAHRVDSMRVRLL